MELRILEKIRKICCRSLQKINAYADALSDIVRLETMRAGYRNLLRGLSLQLIPCQLSPSAGGYMKKPNSRSTTKVMPMVILTASVKVVKNPLISAATVVSLNISNMVRERIFLLSSWNRVINNPIFAFLAETSISWSEYIVKDKLYPYIKTSIFPTREEES